MTRIFLGVAALMASLSGCASAKLVSKDTATGVGVVSIPENTDAWPTHYRPAAIALIEKDTGPNNYLILKEGQVVVGKQTTNNQQVNSDPNFNRQTVTGVTTTSDVTEYHITYKRKSPPSGMPTGLPGAGGLQQTQYMQGPGGMGYPGVQPAGGIVPGAGPAGGMYPAGGVPGATFTYPSR